MVNPLVRFLCWGRNKAWNICGKKVFNGPVLLFRNRFKPICQFLLHTSLCALDRILNKGCRCHFFPTRGFPPIRANQSTPIATTRPFCDRSTVPDDIPKLAPLEVYARRQIRHLLGALAVVAVALSLGIAGYHWIAKLPWLDSLLNASMILGGMGPVDPLTSAPAKFFASIYALFAGLVFMVTMGILVTPLVHRLAHALHIDEEHRRRKTKDADKAPTQQS